MAASRQEDANGQSQRDYMTKTETSLPTISLEAMMLSCAIDAKEGRHVTVTDILGLSFMQTWTKMCICYSKA